jgi:hypothetical protein
MKSPSILILFSPCRSKLGFLFLHGSQHMVRFPSPYWLATTLTPYLGFALPASLFVSLIQYLHYLNSSRIIVS